MIRRGSRILLTAVGLTFLAMMPRTANAFQLFPAAEVQEAHALRQRVLAEVPQLDSRQLPEQPRLSPETLPPLQQRLAALQTREASNPFFHWAQGEALRQTAGLAAARPAFERAWQAAGSRALIHWLLWQEFLRRDLTEEAQREERTLQMLQLRWGLSRFPLLSGELTQHAKDAVDSGDLARATALYDGALANIPESPEALIGRATTLWQGDKSRLLQAGGDLVRSVYYSLQGPQARFDVTSNLLLSLLMAGMVALVLVAAILAVKTQPLFAHDLNERLFSALPASAQFSLGLLLFLLPVLLGLGVLWGAVIALAISAPYLTRREQAMVSVLLALLVVLPAGYERVAASHLLAASPQLSMAQVTEQGGHGEALLEGLRRWAQAAPNSGLPGYYLALVLKRRGDLSQADAEMARAAHLLSRAAFVQVGLGNLQYLQGRMAEAEASYRQAATIEPRSAAAQMNLAQLHAQRLELDQSNEALAKAIALDPHMARTLSKFHGQGMTELVTDEPVPRDVLRASLPLRVEEVRAVAEGLWGTPLRGVSLRLLPSVAVGLLILFWGYALLRGRLQAARRCHQCGAAFCAKCQLHPKEKELCGPCAAVFRPREGVAAFVKVRRHREVEDWLRGERTRVAILGSVVPGGNDVYRGRVLLGLSLCVPAIWLVLEGGFLDALTPSFRFASLMPGPVRWTAVLLLLLTLYAVSIRRSWRKAGAELR